MKLTHSFSRLSQCEWQKKSEGHWHWSISSSKTILLAFNCICFFTKSIVSCIQFICFVTFFILCFCSLVVLPTSTFFSCVNFQVPLIIIVPHPGAPHLPLLPLPMTATSYYGNHMKLQSENLGVHIVPVWASSCWEEKLLTLCLLPSLCYSYWPCSAPLCWTLIYHKVF